MIQKEACPFRVGEDVTTQYIPTEKKVVRKITAIEPSRHGYIATADGGKPCSHCGLTGTTITDYIDSSWFSRVVYLMPGRVKEHA